MDMSPQFSWLSELDMEDLLLLHDEVPDMNCLDELIIPRVATFLGDKNDHNFQGDGGHHHHSFSSSLDSTSNSNTAKQPPPATTAAIGNSTTTTATGKNLCMPVILNFGSASMSSKEVVTDDNNQEYVSPLKRQRPQEEEVVEEKEFVYADDDDDQQAVVKNSTRKSSGETPVAKRKPNTTTSTKPRAHTRDHIMAERRRREKISERFIALSALVPGLKRMDKTSVLGEAIKYVKQLQERINLLEEQNSRKGVESFSLGKKSQMTFEEDNNSSSHTDGDDNLPSNNGGCHQPSPEIEARVSDKTLLLKIQCQKRHSILVQILSAVEKLRLSITSIHATPFGDATLDITIIAQMEKEMDIRPEHIVRDLSLLF